MGHRRLCPVIQAYLTLILSRSTPSLFLKYHAPFCPAPALPLAAQAPFAPHSPAWSQPLRACLGLQDAPSCPVSVPAHLESWPSPPWLVRHVPDVPPPA